MPVMKMTARQRRGALYALYTLGFLYALHGFLPVYVNSNFLTQFTSDKVVGLLYTAGSIVAILVFLAVPRILRRFGNYQSALVGTVGAALATLGLAYFDSLWWLAPLFLIELVLIRIVGFNLDEFIEHYSTDTETGGIRGSFLTIQNIALVVSPLLAGFIVGNNQYWRVYLTAAIVLTPLIALLSSHFNHYKDPRYKRESFWQTFIKLKRHKNIQRILMSNIMLRLFYSWMVIYTPIYLHRNLGFAWDEIGIMFTIMLLPFALLEYPLGKLADTRFGEKEILSVGFVIIALTSATISFIGEASFAVWALVLFATRVGASMVEIMTETYFFKKIDDDDSSIIGFFRMVQPLAYVIGPLIASAALIFVDIRFIFVVLGVIMLWSLRYSLSLKDTL